MDRRALSTKSDRIDFVRIYSQRDRNDLLESVVTLRNGKEIDVIVDEW
jgi:hypothetical protein